MDGWGGVEDMQVRDGVGVVSFILLRHLPSKFDPGPREMLH